MSCFSNKCNGSDSEIFCIENQEIIYEITNVANVFTPCFESGTLSPLTYSIWRVNFAPICVQGTFILEMNIHKMLRKTFLVSFSENVCVRTK